MENLAPGSTIYIAGKMRGEHCFNFKNFFFWQVMLENGGYKVLNPAEHDCMKWINEGWIFDESQYEEVLAYDFELIENQADALFVLEGWLDSEGAKREIEHAKECGKPVYYQEDIR